MAEAEVLEAAQHRTESPSPSGASATLGASAPSPCASATSSPARRFPTAPFFPSPKRQPRRVPVERSDGSGQSEERRAAQLRARRLEEEIQDLREAYARKIASVELKCENMLREKDSESNTWLKERKGDITRMKAGVTIMKAMFDKKKEKFEARMQEEKKEFERQKDSFRLDAERMKALSSSAQEQFLAELKAKEHTYELQIRELSRQKAEREEVCRAVEGHLREARASTTQLKETNESLKKEVEQLRKRVVESERSEELSRKDAQIQSLDQELTRTKKIMHESRHAETEALRKELMDYVAFIVRILPDDWRNFEGLPKEVKDRLKAPGAAMTPRPGPGEVADRAPRPSVPTWSAPMLPQALPPLGQHGGSPKSWRQMAPTAAGVRF